MSTATHILKAEALVKYVKGRTLLNQVHLQIQSGQVIGLLGPNGAGKTTFFKILIGALRADSGQLTFDSEDIQQLPMYARARLGLGYLPQESALFRDLTVHDNIMLSLENRHERLPLDQLKKRCRALLERFDLLHLEYQLAQRLSGGEKRRLEFARSLALEPKFLLLDEPFAAVDPLSVEQLQRWIQRLRDLGIGILITDHNVRETLAICDYSYILYQGQILAEGDQPTLLSNPAVRQYYLGERFQL
jgi:lipopolysaccharide export system ATP-binding protein